MSEFDDNISWSYSIVTGPRANVSTRVESLIQEVKQVYIYFKWRYVKSTPFSLANTSAKH